MIGNPNVVTADKDSPMEVVQTEEAGEEKSPPPEWERNPSIEVIIVPGRRVIGDYRRTFIIIVVVYYRRIRLRLIFSILPRAAGYDSQPEFRGNTLERF